MRTEVKGPLQRGMATRAVSSNRGITRVNGFTLVEMIIGTFILSVILIALGTGMMVFVRTNVKNKYTGEATSLGNRVLEEYRMTGYGDITSSSGPLGKRYYQSTIVNTDTVLHKKEIKVIISWPDTMVQNTISFQTIIAGE